MPKYSSVIRVVLEAVIPKPITHKTDVGGVQLNLGDGDVRLWRVPTGASRRQSPQRMGAGHFRA